MKTTLDYCKNCRGIFNKIGSYLDWLLFTVPPITFITIIILSIICSLVCFETNMKDDFIYPDEEYIMLEEIAIRHSNKAENIIEISDLPQNVEINITITEDKIISKYSVPRTKHNILDILEKLSVTIEQNSHNFEITNMSRNYEEDSYISSLRTAIVSVLTAIISCSFSLFLFIIQKILELLNNIGLEKRRVQYIKELSTLENATKYSMKQNNQERDEA